MAAERIAVEGRNCWRRASAKRAAVLIDGDAYFAAFRSAVERAERRVLVIGWDMHSRTPIPAPGNGAPEPLVDFLRRVLARRPDLDLYVLDWSYILLYAIERERFPARRWSIDPRLHFRLDGRHPPGASHHQKLVVIDDALAFVGSVDLSGGRWDTPDHRADEPGRVGPDGKPYPPVHDVTLAFDGEAAAAIAELGRERWWRATGDCLPAVPADGDPWPEGLVPGFHEVEVAIARTVAAFDGRPPVREVEALHVDSIAAARRSIYLENLYLTSTSVTESLAARLAEADGPEVVIVTPRRYRPWHEEATMGALRARAVERLRAADRFRRLRVCYPIVPALGERPIKVHSKLAVIDDRFLRIGSANLANRSMALDSECDVALEAAGDERRRFTIAGVRDRLLGEHLGAEAAAVRAITAETGSLLAAIDRLGLGPRRLEPLDGAASTWFEDVLPPTVFADPERPVDRGEVFESFLPDLPGSRRGTMVRATLLLGFVLAFFVAWRWTPLSRLADPAAMASAAAALAGHPWAPLWVIGAFVAASVIAVPLNLLILGAALAFPPLPGFVYAYVGSMVGAIVTYAIGRALGGDAIRRLAGGRFRAASRLFTERGVFAMAAARLVPVAPFTLVNFVAGAAHLRLRDFVLGTAIGLAPGIATITVLGIQLEKAIESPDAKSLLVVAAIVALLVYAAVRFRRRDVEIS